MSTHQRVAAQSDQSFHQDELAAESEDLSYFEEGESLGESMLSTNNESGIASGLYETVPDIMLLNVYCARAKPPKDTEESRIEADKSWEPVRDWLASHNADEVRAAVEQRGESGLTALHFACRHDPPVSTC